MGKDSHIIDDDEVDVTSLVTLTKKYRSIKREENEINKEMNRLVDQSRNIDKKLDEIRKRRDRLGGEIKKVLTDLKACIAGEDVVFKTLKEIAFREDEDGFEEPPF